MQPYAQEQVAKMLMRKRGWKKLTNVRPDSSDVAVANIH